MIRIIARILYMFSIAVVAIIAIAGIFGHFGYPQFGDTLWSRIGSNQVYIRLIICTGVYFICYPAILMSVWPRLAEEDIENLWRGVKKFWQIFGFSGLSLITSLCLFVAIYILPGETPILVTVAGIFLLLAVFARPD